jgi:hypothetical protein
MIARLEHRLGPLGTALVLALAAQALSIMLYAPLIGFEPRRLLESYGPMCRNPFTTAPIGEPQIRHRILAPLIAYGLGLRGAWGSMVPVAANTLFLMLLYRLLRRDLSPRGAGSVVFLLATTLVVITGQTWWGYPDSVCFLGVLGCLATGSPAAFGVLLFLAMLGDERALFSAPLCLLWHLFREWPRPSWPRHLQRGLAVVLAFAVWILSYRVMRSRFAIVLPPRADWLVSGKNLKAMIEGIPGGMWYALRGAWLLPLTLALAWWRQRRLGALVLYIGAILVALVPGCLVFTISRMGALAFPAVLIAAVQLQERLHDGPGRPTESALLLNLFTPQYQVVSSTFYLYKPLPLLLLRRLIH